MNVQSQPLKCINTTVVVHKFSSIQIACSLINTLSAITSKNVALSCIGKLIKSKLLKTDNEYKVYQKWQIVTLF